MVGTCSVIIFLGYRGGGKSYQVGSVGSSVRWRRKAKGPLLWEGVLGLRQLRGTPWF